MPAWLCMALGSAPSRTRARGGLAASSALGRSTAWLLGAELSCGDGHSVPDSLGDSLAQSGLQEHPGWVKNFFCAPVT